MKRKFITCPCCGERLDPSPSEWRKHYHNPDGLLTDCKTRLAWRIEGDFVRGWQPLLIKGILVPHNTAHMPLDHPCHKKYPLNPSLPLPCWTPRVIMSLLGNPLNFHPIKRGEWRMMWTCHINAVSFNVILMCFHIRMMMMVWCHIRIIATCSFMQNQD